jgi:hypothetical protein
MLCGEKTNNEKVSIRRLSAKNKKATLSFLDAAFLRSTDFCP